MFASLFTYAADSPDPRAEQAFQQQFAGADNVRWSKADNDMLKVSFTWAGQSALAFFTKDGRFAGAARNLQPQQLPLAIMMGINKRFVSPVIITAKEISNEEGTSYSVLLEDNKGKYNVTLNSAGEIISKEKAKA